jgi:hypothetical protein
MIPPMIKHPTMPITISVVLFLPLLCVSVDVKSLLVLSSKAIIIFLEKLDTELFYNCLLDDDLIKKTFKLFNMVFSYDTSA